MAGREREANNEGRVNKAAKQVHEAGGSGRTSEEDSDHAAVVDKNCTWRRDQWAKATNGGRDGTRG